MARPMPERVEPFPTPSPPASRRRWPQPGRSSKRLHDLRHLHRWSGELEPGRRGSRCPTSVSPETPPTAGVSRLAPTRIDRCRGGSSRQGSCGGADELHAGFRSCLKAWDAMARHARSPARAAGNAPTPARQHDRLAPPTTITPNRRETPAHRHALLQRAHSVQVPSPGHRLVPVSMCTRHVIGRRGVQVPSPALLDVHPIGGMIVSAP
jgi:hypothetical protein